MAVMVRDDAALRARLPELLAARELAVDTEFHAERTYRPELMLVQLRADDGEALLVDARAGVDLAILREPLSARPWVVHGGDVDVHVLRDAAGAEPPSVFDTQVAAAFIGFRWPSRLSELVTGLLSRPIDKGATMSDWSRRPLTSAQVAYAAEDVLVLGPLAEAIRSRLRGKPAEAFAAECTAARLAAASVEPADGDRWRALAAAVTLSAEERAAARALAAWREAEARAADVPRYNVLGDWLLLDLARRRPRSVPELAENRRVASQLVRRHGQALVDAVAGARNAPSVVETTKPSGEFLSLIRFLCFKCEGEAGISADLLYDEGWATDLWHRGPGRTWREAALGELLDRFYRSQLDVGWPANSPALGAPPREF